MRVAKPAGFKGFLPSPAIACTPAVDSLVRPAVSKLQSFESSQFLGLIDDQVSMFACGGFFECGEPVIGDKDAAGFRNTKVGVFRADSVEHAREMVRQLISNLLKCQRWMALNLLFRLTVRFSLRQSFRKKLLCRANCLRTIFSMRMSG